MYLIVTSKQDEASMNILNKLIEKKEWKAIGTFEGNPCLSMGEYVIVTINEYHLYYNDIDIAVKNELGFSPDVIIVASKHRSESGMATLTVHPIGNFAKAEFGGKDRTLVQSSPGMMTEALRILHKKSRDAALTYKISLEVTHHGPYLDTPCFFIEIGSLEPQWNDKRAAEIIAETILETTSVDYPVALGVGGGHYTPRITDVALSNKISFGHMIPSYAIDKVDDEILDDAISKSPNASLVYFHRKAMKKADYRTLKDMFSSRGLKPVREGDLEDL